MLHQLMYVYICLEVTLFRSQKYMELRADTDWIIINNKGSSD